MVEPREERDEPAEVDPAEDTGDYTVDRRRLFDGLTMEEILAAFRRGEGARPSDA